MESTEKNPIGIAFGLKNSRRMFWIETTDTVEQVTRALIKSVIKAAPDAIALGYVGEKPREAMLTDHVKDLVLVIEVDKKKLHDLRSESDKNLELVSLVDRINAFKESGWQAEYFTRSMAAVRGFIKTDLLNRVVNRRAVVDRETKIHVGWAWFKTLINHASEIRCLILNEPFGATVEKIMPATENNVSQPVMEDSLVSTEPPIVQIAFITKEVSQLPKPMTEQVQKSETFGTPPVKAKRSSKRKKVVEASQNQGIIQEVEVGA
ncbi:MAG: hypothetical protein ACD_58C00239G0004 [uncultured bacterium]|nr:MAG: hypothetical protein ACD_58C00239G0004 [uncultured bacterium]